MPVAPANSSCRIVLSMKPLMMLASVVPMAIADIAFKARSFRCIAIKSSQALLRKCSWGPHASMVLEMCTTLAQIPAEILGSSRLLMGDITWAAARHGSHARLQRAISKIASTRRMVAVKNGSNERNGSYQNGSNEPYQEWHVHFAGTCTCEPQDLVAACWASCRS